MAKTYTEEEMQNIVLQARQIAVIREVGNAACIMAKEYLQDQVNRKIIPANFVNVFDMIHQTFLQEYGVPRQQPAQPQASAAPAESQPSEQLQEP